MSTVEHKDGSVVLRRTTEYPVRRSWSTWLIGSPLPTADAPHQTIGKAVGLAVFASDALSSTAYATQEILTILVLASTAALDLAFPISIAIVILLWIVATSYEQTIHAYPNGGGAYIVSRDNLGELQAQVAGAALLTDYILTVAVSISSGVDQISSAFPAIFPYRVGLAVVLIGFVMVVNLRGVREAGTVFAIPTYFFVTMMFITLGTGVFRYLTGALGVVENPPEIHFIEEMQVLSLFLILHAFSSGTAALTGIEAISNGVTAFKEPRSRNAGITLIWMAVILSVLFLGITFFATQINAVPSLEETVVSQIARTVLGGRNLIYLGVIAATTVVLVMAANTAFAGFPRLAALIAKDGFLPRQFAYRGSRLVFSRGIVALAVFASLLVVAFDASVTNLIALYAIGVFMSFTLSQAGMARRWWKSGRLAPGEERVEEGSTLGYDKNWRIKMVLNGIGAFLTLIVMLVFAITKFADGAWFILILIPAVVAVFYAIHRHYKNVAANLSLEDYGPPARVTRHRVIMPLSGVHRGTLAALRYARNLSDDVTAVHVSVDDEEAAKIQRKWETWGEGVRLVILDSPYRLLIEPLLEYIEEMADQRQPNETISVVVPQFVTHKWYNNLLHMQTAWALRLALIFRPGVVVIDVPYQVE